MSETALVYIYSAAPAKAFRGCGALIEGGYIATCRHVWRLAAGKDEGAAVEVEFPYGVPEQGRKPRRPAMLADFCESGDGAAPDLVLLRPDGVPAKVQAVEPAAHSAEQFGAGFVMAGLRGLDPNSPNRVDARKVAGTIDEVGLPDGVHQFVGSGQPTYWFRHGASGSPAFLNPKFRLAGLLTSSELGEDGAASDIHEAVVIPGMVIRAHAVRAMWQAALPAGVANGHADGPSLDGLILENVLLRDMPARIGIAIQAIRARAAVPVAKSNDGAAIDDTIAASRRKLADVDTQGARALLRERIAEAEARITGLVRLLKEQAAVERLAFDYVAAKASRTRITQLAPDDVWNWIALGDLHVTTGGLDAAASAFRGARDAASRTGDERDLSISHERLGDVLVTQGNLPAALAAYRARHEIAERLAASDPGNAEWQRDLSISHDRLGNVLVAQGDLAAALAAYRAGMTIAERLAASDPGNAQWQRDLSISHERLGDVLVEQGDLAAALAAYRAGMTIPERLAASDPGNAQWQRDLSVTHNKLGDVLVAQGDLPAALAAYRASMTVRERLAASDPGNAQWQRDLSISHERHGDVLVAQGDLAAALTAYRAGMTIRERLAASDPGNAEWQRDVWVSHNKLGDVLVAQGDLPAALAAYRASMTIAEHLAASDPGNAQWQRDLSISHEKLGDVLVAQGDLPAALAAYRADMAIVERLAASDPGNAQWQRDLSIGHNKLGNVLVAQGDLPAALAAYRAGMTIAERLAASDPGNAQWQRDLSISHEKLGDVLVAQGDLPAALAAYRAGMTIRERLAASDPGNAEWQRDLMVSCVKIADTSPDAARAALTRALDIAGRLAGEGRLAPADAWLPDELARRLRELARG